MRWCPECGAEYPHEVVACRDCRAVLVDEPPDQAAEPVVVHKVPDVVAGALLVGLLEHQGIEATLRSTELPGYPSVPRDWGTTSWGEILVPRADAIEARAVIADYLAELERGGAVRDEDVEGTGEGGTTP